MYTSHNTQIHHTIHTIHTHITQYTHPHTQSHNARGDLNEMVSVHTHNTMIHARRSNYHKDTKTQQIKENKCYIFLHTHV